MDYFKSKRKDIVRYLETFFAEKDEELSAVNFLGVPLGRRLFEFTREGKMIRGGLVSLGYQLFSGLTSGSETEESLVSAGAAMELFQTALLIHDDIMDRDKQRRGRESIFYQYVMNAQEQLDNDAYHTGEALGICAGDVAFFLGFELLTKVAVDYQSYKKIINRCAKELSYVGIAQMQDVYFGTTKGEVTDQDIVNLYRYKTGRYTFSLPLSVGCIIAGRQADTLEKIEALGELLGIIFQIKDDELGLFGEETEIGKPVGSDIIEGKKTLFSLFLRQAVQKEELDRIEQIFGNSTIGSDEIDYIRKLIDTNGIRSRVNDIVGKLAEQIDETILALGELHEDGKERLRRLVDYLLTRTK